MHILLGNLFTDFGGRPKVSQLCPHYSSQWKSLQLAAGDTRIIWPSEKRN